MKIVSRNNSTKRRSARSAAALAAALVLLVTALLAGIPGLSLTAEAAEGFEGVARFDQGSAMAGAITYGMTPIYGSDIEDGTYVLDVSSSSQFFKILEAKVTVEDGQMTAVLTMYSKSYSHVYMGTPEEAAAADLEDYIPLVTTDDGRWTFTIPVEALNSCITLSSFSVRRHMWYGRELVFEAASLPSYAIGYAIPDYSRIEEAMELYDEANGTDSLTELYGSGYGESYDLGDEPSEAVEMELDDGTYSIEVQMTGGSGRADIMSPTWLYVEDGRGYAKLLWSSSYYDYMIVGGVRYDNETTDGSNSTFTIPITELDEPMHVIADTTAMGDPLAIEYLLTFYPDTVGNVGRIPQEATRVVIVAAVIVIVGGGILNHFVKKRRGR